MRILDISASDTCMGEVKYNNIQHYTIIYDGSG